MDLKKRTPNIAKAKEQQGHCWSKCKQVQMFCKKYIYSALPTKFEDAHTIV